MHTDLYGTTSDDIEEAKASVEAALECSLNRHESTYTSGDYYRADLMNGEVVTLKNNIDPFDGKPLETNFPNYFIILYISNTRRSPEIKSALRGGKVSFILLRHK